MSVPVEKLASLESFQHLAPDRLAALARSFSLRSLLPGDILWEEGQPSLEMALVISGALRVRVGAQEVGEVREGEILGEAAVFTRRASRSATVTVVEASEVIIMPVYELATLRMQEGDLYDAVLDQALSALCRRISATDREISRLSAGSEDKPTERVPGITRMVKAFRKATSEHRIPPLEPLLERLPNLRPWHSSIYKELKEVFVPEPIQPNEILFRQGDTGGTAYLVAQGEVEVIRMVRGRRAEVIATLNPGDLFGTLNLVSGASRTATCRISQKGWLYRLAREDYLALKGPARDSFKECLVATFGVQLRNANLLLRKLREGSHRGGPLSDVEYQALLKEAGTPPLQLRGGGLVR